MENDGVDLSAGNPLDLTPQGALAKETVPIQNINPIAPVKPVDLSGAGQGLFGSNKTVYQPQTGNPLDDAEKLLKAKRDRQQIGLTGPMSGILQFLAPKEVQKLGEDAAQTDLQIQQIREKKQQQADMQKAAELAGLPAGSLPATATNDTLVNAMAERFRKTGDVNTMNALIARGHKDIVATYMPDAVAAQETKVEREKGVIDKLNAAASMNQKAYNDVLKNISPEDKKEFKIPETITGWMAVRNKAFNDNQQSQQMVANFKQQRAQWTDFTAETDKNAAEVRQNSFKLANGEVMPGTSAVNHLGNGAKGVTVPPGSQKGARAFGEKDGWSFYGKDQSKTISEEIEATVPKVEREKHVGLLRIYDQATHDRDGNPLPPDKINTNPNVLTGIKEGMTAFYRGGAGGTNMGLLKTQLHDRGWTQTMVDNLLTNIAGTGAITGKEREYISSLTQKQTRDVLDFLSAYSKKDMGSRLSGAAEHAGYYGARLDQIPLEPELRDAVKDAHAFGRDKQKYELSQKPYINRDNDMVLLEGGKASLAVPGVMVTPLPLSALPGLTPGTDRGTGKNGLPPASGGSPANPATLGAPSGQGGGASAPPTVPPIVKNNPVAAAVYGAAGQVFAGPNGGGTPAAQNAAVITTSAARSESAFNPNATHDGGIGYGLFGHNQDRLKAMQEFAGTKPGEPIPAATQAQFFAQEMKTAASKDKFIADTINNPNASAADLTKVQIRLEKPAGYTGPGSEEKIPSWGQRLSNTQAMMGGGGKPQPTPEQIAAYMATQPALAARLRQQNLEGSTRSAANIAPALGATAGMLAGPAGALAGGAAGGAVRQAFNGGPGYTDQMVRGAAEAIPAAIPGLGPAATAARVVAAGAVPAAEKLYDTGGQDTGGAIEAGAAGAVGGITGEVGLRALGRGFGMVGDKIFSGYTTPVQKEIAAAAKTLATQEPKIADATGKMVPNKAYEQAEQVIKDRLPKTDVEHVVYAYNTSKQGVASAQANPKGAIPGAAITEGEALSRRPGMTEAARIGRQEYTPIREEMAAAGGSIPVAAHAPLPNGPASTIRTPQNPNGTVPDTPFWQKQVQHYEINATGPAKSVDEKWNRIGTDRSELLGKERDAMASNHPNKDEFVKGFRAIADSLRAQQEAMARALLPPDKADALITRLETADKRYRAAVTAGGPDIVKTIAKGGAEGLQAQTAFNALVGNDPTAKRLVNALVAVEHGQGRRAGVAGGLAAITIPLHSVPVVGQALSAVTATISTVQGYRLLRELMAKKGAGAPVKFETMLRREMASKGYAARAGSAIGSSVGSQMVQ